jgi:hypothetical protein
MKDATAVQFNRGIGHMPQVLAVDSDQGRLEQGG